MIVLLKQWQKICSLLYLITLNSFNFSGYVQVNIFLLERLTFFYPFYIKYPTKKLKQNLISWSFIIKNFRNYERQKSLSFKER